MNKKEGKCGEGWRIYFFERETCFFGWALSVFSGILWVDIELFFVYCLAK